MQVMQNYFCFTDVLMENVFLKVPFTCFVSVSKYFVEQCVSQIFYYLLITLATLNIFPLVQHLAPHLFPDTWLE